MFYDQEYREVYYFTSDPLISHTLKEVCSEQYTGLYNVMFAFFVGLVKCCALFYSFADVNCIWIRFALRHVVTNPSGETMSMQAFFRARCNGRKYDHDNFSILANTSIYFDK